MEMTTKQLNLIIAAVGGAVIWVVLSAILLLFESGSEVARYIVAIGGGLAGYIQAICYALAIFVFLELKEMLRVIGAEYDAFSAGLLPEQEHLVLTPEKVIGIKLEVIKREKEGKPNMLTTLIKKVCNQYRNENSVQDTYSMLFSQIRTMKDTLESRLEPLHYLVSVITMLGFIGTIIGLTNGIFHAAPLMAQIDPNDKMSGFMVITSDFSMAFGSTLVALLLVIWVNRYYHRYLGQLDSYFAQAETYVTDNLVSRIYKEK